MAETNASSPRKYHMEAFVADHDQNQDGSAISDDFKKGVKYLVDTRPGMKKLPPEYVLPLPGSPLPTSHADIPVIDLSGLGGPPESRISTIKAISSACASWGFFRIVNHGLDVALIREMMKVAEEFFGLSPTEKMRYASDDVLSPVRYGTSLNTSKKHSLHWRDFLRHHAQHVHLWPVNPPKYRIVAEEYLEQLRKLMRKIGGAISEGLGLDERYIEETLLRDGLQIIAVNYYPPCPEPDKTLGLAPHSDHGAITILMDNGVDGLQVKHNGSWVAVHNVPGTFVVNVGDCLEVLTNAKYRSVEHRATVNAEKTRISVAVAHGPNLSRYIFPASPLVDEGQELYQPILYKEYMRLQQSSTVREKTALEAIRTQRPLQ